MSVERTVNEATKVVLEKELNFFKRLALKIQGEPCEQDIAEYIKERKRLYPKYKFDHEDFFGATGFYTTGRGKE